MEVSRKWQFHFFDDLASHRYYLPISSPPHREHSIRLFIRETMWEICFERGAKSIFRLSERFYRQTDIKGMMCIAYGDGSDRKMEHLPKWLRRNIRMLKNGYGLERMG